MNSLSMCKIRLARWSALSAVLLLPMVASAQQFRVKFVVDSTQTNMGSVTSPVNVPPSMPAASWYAVTDGVDIVATPKAGFAFDKWIVTQGNGALDSDTSPSTGLTVINLPNPITSSTTTSVVIKATFKLPDNQLTVSTLGSGPYGNWGSPSFLGLSYWPAYGGAGTTIVAGVTSPFEIGGGFWGVCTGYTGTGSASTGSGTNTTVTINTNSTLTWGWKVRAKQVPFSVTSKNLSGVVVGNPQPPDGTTNLPYVVSSDNYGYMVASVTSPYYLPSFTERDIVSGYTGSGGGDMGSGTGSVTSVRAITVTNSLTWNWNTEYLLTIGIDGNGSVGASPAGSQNILLAGSRWYPIGTIVTLTANQTAQDKFLIWSGDDIAANRNVKVQVTMNGPKSVKAHFGLVEPDSNGDGIPDAWCERFGLNPTNSTILGAGDNVSGAFDDPDRDGLNNLLEYRIWTSFTNQPALAECSPIDADSDGDNIDDGYEYKKVLPFNTAPGVPGSQTNMVAVVTPDGMYGEDGNPDGDYLWDTATGYVNSNSPLTTIKEWTGPDDRPPCVYRDVTVPGVTHTVHRYCNESDPLFPTVTGDTGDQSSSDSTDSEVAGPTNLKGGDGFDDGFEYSWDQWQGNHAGDPIGDPLGRSVPNRFSVAGPEPTAAIVADFTFDKTNDVAVCNFAFNDVCFFNNVNGLLYLQTKRYNLPAGSGPVAMAKGCLREKFGATNDLVVVNKTGNSVTVLLNKTNTFDIATYSTGISSPVFAALADFNGDTNTDIAVANSGDGSVTILTNNTKGIFAWYATIPGVAVTPSCIAAGQIYTNTTKKTFNDLIVADNGSNSVRVIKNDAGVFTNQYSINVGGQPTSIVLDDFNHDKVNDFVVTVIADDLSSVQKYDGAGGGAFSFSQRLSAGPTPYPIHITAGYFDSQTSNDLDIAVAAFSNKSARVYLGNRDGSLSARGTVDLKTPPVWVAMGDITGDGNAELIAVCRSSHLLAIFRGHADGSMETYGELATSTVTVDRRFNPAKMHPDDPDGGRPDYDVMYNPKGGVGDWNTDYFEYHAWDVGLFSNTIVRLEHPTWPRCTNPFLWDTDHDGLPDGWEIAFQYDAWKQISFGGSVADGDVNPDGDGYAVSGNLIHHQVYTAPGVNTAHNFNPNTGWQCPDPNNPPPFTGPFGNRLEMLGGRTTPAAIPNDPNDRSTNPRLRDTDGDGMWDGWELYVGFNPIDPGDGGKDSDLDGLSNLQEFLCTGTLLAETGWQLTADGLNVPGVLTADQTAAYQVRATFVAGWKNKTLPCDPFDPDTDGDQISDGAERSAFNSLGTTATPITTLDSNQVNILTVNFIGGGLSPTSVDTDGDGLPDFWEASFKGSIDSTNAMPTGNGMDGTVPDALLDYDGDGLKNFQEYMTGSVPGWQYAANNGEQLWVGGKGIYGYDPFDYFDETLSASGARPYGDAMTSYGGARPKYWDPHYIIGPITHRVPYNYLTAAEPPMRPQYFSTTSPLSTDSDDDGMDDYWEVYHMLNPIYGTRDLVNEKVTGVANVHGGLTYDPAMPWTVGTWNADPDGDGLPNLFESIQPENGSTAPYNYHTDPTPMWMSDVSYQQSFCNLYYWLGVEFGILGQYPWFINEWQHQCSFPQYLFDFEMNEGFDTDNDGIGDRAELVSNATKPGKTDPLDSGDPIKRRALYLNGDAAARSQDGINLGWEVFRNFSVEAWVRPANPATGEEQVIVERPGSIPIGNPLGYPNGIRLNFRLGLDANGCPFVGYNGAGFDTLFVEAKAGPQLALTANRWTHLAGVYDGVNGRLILYVNGQMASMTPSLEVPCNGSFAVGSINVAVNMPVVIGARDSAPDGAINGAAALVTTIAGLTQDPPQLDRYFTGWVDEVRLWSGTRSQSDIQGNMARRFTFKDVADVNTNATPARELVYCFSFDDLPDPDHSGPAPAGFELLAGYPATGVLYTAAPWWALAPDHSLAYDEYRYVPWIDNLASHAPRTPPSDSFIYTNNMVTITVSNGMTNTFTTVFPNTSNPYIFQYRTKIAPGLAVHEHHPFFGAIDAPEQALDGLYGDLLPLHWAQADEDVPMWDNGSIPALTPFDTDGDGLPDEWEMAHGLDPRSAVGVNGAEGDPDGDGLNNFYEYLCGTDPWNTDTGNTGLSDANKDSDGDHLSNIKELQHGTLPNVKDTDDDGLTDWEEVTGEVDPVWDATRPATSPRPRTISDPLNSLSPTVPRSVYLNGAARLIVPPADKLMSTNWTVEAWIKPDTNSTGGILVSRYVQGVVPGQYGINYELGLSTNSSPGTLRLYTRYAVAQSNVVTETRVDGTGTADQTNGLAGVTVPLNAWTCVAGVYNSASNMMLLYVNGKLAAYRQDVGDYPPTVFGYATSHWGDEVTIGASRSTGTVSNGFKGYMDNVRIWSIARSTAQIADRYNAPEGDPPLFNSKGVKIKSGSISVDSMASQEAAVVADNRATHMLVKFASEAIAQDNANLASMGVQVLNYVAPGVRAVTTTGQQLASLGAKVVGSALLKSSNKISPLLNVGSNGARNVVVSFFKDTAEADAVAAVQAAGGVVYNNKYLAASDLVATLNDSQLTALAGNNAVAWIYPAGAFLTSGGPVHRLADHIVGGSETAPFAVNGDGWDGPGRGSAYLTYHFVNYNSNLDPALAKSTVIKGVMRWSAVAAIYFTETAEAGKSFSMDVLWEPIDGPGGVLGFGYYPNDINPEPVAGDFHLDSAETWFPGMKAGAIDLDYVSCHEGGHCLGMAHSDDPTAVMYPYYDGTRDSTLAPDDIKGIQTIYGMPVVVGALAEFHFDDGGLTAEDSTMKTNWLQNWSSAAVLDGAIFSTNTVAPLNKDTDGDGLPDWWEMANGLDPYDGTGVNGSAGDPDNDGLSNLGEYLAGTDPYTWDTDGDGFSDYDSRRGPGFRTWGEIYDDGDGIPDLWEVQYRGPCPATGKRGLDPSYYDGNLDPDEDGWSNYAEYLAGTDPLSWTNCPKPQVSIHARYHGRYGNTLTEAFTIPGTIQVSLTGEDQGAVQANQVYMDHQLAHSDVVPGSLRINVAGTLIATDDGQGGLTSTANTNLTGLVNYATGFWSISAPGGVGAGTVTADYAYKAGGQLKMSFYKSPAMDGFPIATLEMGAEYLTTTDFTTGHLVEGNNYVFAYLDRNGNNKWEPDSEPAGIGQAQPFNVGWGAVNNIEIGLTDEMPGYPRFTWDAVTNATRYIVTYDVNGVNKIRRTIQAPRNYFHEGDYLYAGLYGIATNTAPVFLIYKDIEPDGYLTFVTTPAIPAYSLITPSISTPNGSMQFQYAKNEMEFIVDTNSTAYRLQIATTSNGTPIVNAQGIVPYLDVNGVRKVTLPFYAGDNYVPPAGGYAVSNWANGLYWARVQGSTPATISAFSPWSSFIVDVKSPTLGGKSVISGDVYYFGKVGHGFGAGQNSNLTIIVQAFDSVGFGGVADGQVQVSYQCNTNAPSVKKGDYTLAGLRSVSYYVRAFIDVNGNRQLDSWEPMGFAQQVTSNGYEAVAIDLTGQGSSAQGNVRVVIRDRDTDDDGIPDGWEWMYYGTLGNGSSNVAANGMTLLRNYEIEPMDLDPTLTDYDGDGVSDVDEITYSDRVAGRAPDTSHYDPYDPVTNPHGTDLNPTKWDTDGDGLSDGYEIAHGLNPLNPADGATEIARARAAGEVIPGAPSVTQIATVTPDDAQFTLSWQGQIGMSYEVQYSDNMVTWQSAPNGTRYTFNSPIVHTYMDMSPKVATRFYRVVVK